MNQCLLLKNKTVLSLLLVLLFSGAVNAATKTSTGTGGNWNAAATWVGGIVPVAGDNVVIATTGTNKVTLVANTTCVNLTINTGSILDIIDKNLTVNGNIILNGTCKSTAGSSGKIEWNKNGGTLDGFGTFSNIDQLDTNGFPKTILATANITFTNASIDGNGNIITNNGIVNISGSNGFAAGSATTWANLGTLNYGSPTFLATLTATATGNTVNYTGAAQTAKVTTYENLTLSGSLMKTFATTPTVNGILSLEGTATVKVTVGVVAYGAAATLQYNKPAAYIATLEEWPATFNGAGGVIITNAGVITLGAAKAITNNFSIATGSKANLGTFTHTTGTLTIGDEGTVLGSWGSTSSPATNQNNTFFTAATTGIVNVSSSSCTTTTWNGISWSKGTPTSGKKIVFNSAYTSTGSISGCSCQVSAGDVHIDAGHNLILGGKLTVTAPGTLTFENNASLVQTTYTGANTGNITYKRNTTTNREFDYTYWSSPVAAQNLLGVSPSTKTDKFFSFDAAANNWVQENPSATTMTVGKGYIVRGVPPPPAPAVPPGLYTTSFFGEPNNGTKTIAIVGGAKSNLIGNPYPSALYADTFLSANSSAIDGTIYFWTHNTAIQDRNNILSTAGSGAYAYTSDDYAVYNTTGGTASAPSDPSYPGGNIPTGKIAAGQSFFTTSTVAGGTVTFTNAMRVDLGIPLDNSNFYRTTTNTKKANTIEKNRIWLNLTNTQGAFKQTLVGYITNATNDYDGLFDGESLDGNKFVDFYSVNQGKNLTIQGRTLPFNDTDEVPLGLKTTIAGNFTINIDQVDGLLTNQAVFIEDKLMNTVFDLKSGNYTFTTVAGTFNERFVLRYNNKTLSVDEKDKEDEILVFYSNNYKTLIIHNNVVDSIVNSVTLFNITGQNILNWDVKDGEQTNIQIPIKNISSGIYIVKVKTMKGESSKKIIVN